MVATMGSDMKGMGWELGTGQSGVPEEMKGASAQFMPGGGIKPASGQW